MDDARYLARRVEHARRAPTPPPDPDYQDQSGHLDGGEDHVQPGREVDAPVVDRRREDDDADGRRNGGYFQRRSEAPTEGQRDGRGR